MRYLFLFLLVPIVADGAPIDFDRQIAPLLARRCLDCHSGSEAKGELNLTRKGQVIGGDSAVIVPGKLAESRLWERVAANEMPPKKPLSAAEKELLKEWIAAGAKWGQDPIQPFQFTTDFRAGYDWWALQPLKVVAAPSNASHPIDAFVQAKLVEKKLTPSGKADRRTLVRRLAFDLTGLPPTYSQVQAFLEDTRPDAYERLVDAFLASPHYAERWTRHWLDVVRFGESDGFERDLPRLNAWHYRDWVMKAINEDLPYDRFVQMQLAADALTEDRIEASKALGFLVAGAHDIVVPASEKMKQTMRQDELEDVIGTVGQTFLGMTVHCARCHDHKFDPIEQKDYFQLLAGLNGLNPGERIVTSRTAQQAFKQIQQESHQIEDRLSALKTLAQKRIKQKAITEPVQIKAWAEWDFTQSMQDQVNQLELQLRGSAKRTVEGLVLNGLDAYAISAPLPKTFQAKTLEAWVKLTDLDQRGGGVIALQSRDGNLFDAIVFAEKEPREWLAGSDFFRRSSSFQGSKEKEAVEQFIHIALVYAADGTITGYRQGQLYGQPYMAKHLQPFMAQESVLTVGIRHEPANAGKLLKGIVQRVKLYDRALTASEIADSANLPDSPTRLFQALQPNEQQEWLQLQQKQHSLQKQLKEIKQSGEIKVYTGSSFEPATTHVLLRGNVDSPSEAVQVGPIRALRQHWPTDTDPAKSEPARRLALAKWITAPSNALFQRVMVNRVWHYHFGAGIVDSPNDFGFNGGRPCHPELLDWLCNYFVHSGYSLKALHRMMVTSETYQQQSKAMVENAKIDQENRFLWRANPHRMEAETVRDSMLMNAQLLQQQLYGPSFQDFKSYFFKGTQFYDPIEQTSAELHRRTVYRMWARGGRNPFLDTFDCPDPSTSTPKRAMTTTPLQALTMLNNSFVLHLSEVTGQQLQQQFPNRVQAQIEALYHRLLQRSPTEQELQRQIPFVQQYGMAALARVLWNSAEFCHLD